MPTDLDYAWAAGFFDGEGCSHGYRGGPKSRPALMLVISQSSDTGPPETLIRFKELFGAQVYAKRPSTLSKKPRYQWSASAVIATDAMAKMWPYLGQEKREQWNRAVERVLAAKAERKEMVRSR